MLRSTTGLLLLAALLTPGAASAQILGIDFERGEVIVQNCRGTTSVATFEDAREDGSVFDLRFSIDGGPVSSFTLDERDLSRREQVSIANAGFEDIPILLVAIADPAWNDFLRFLGDGLDCLGSGSIPVSDRPLTADPVVNQSIQTFQQIVTMQRARVGGGAAGGAAGGARGRVRGQAPGEAAGGDPDDPPGLRGLPGADDDRAAVRQVSADLEYEYFEVDQLSGDNIGARAGYARISGSGRWTFGINGFYNRLTLDDPPAGVANTLGTSPLFSDNGSASAFLGFGPVGVNASYLYFADGDDGFGGALYLVQPFRPGSVLFTVGTMAQYVQIGDLQNLYVHVAALLGIPLGRRAALNVDALLLWHAEQWFNEISIALEDDMVLNPGAYLTLFLTDAFALNLGGRTVLLLEGYTSYEFTLGAGFRF